MKIKVFTDDAKLEDMRAVYHARTAQGSTTNPTLMRQAGIADYTKFASEVLTEITGLPISFVVFADDRASMEKQARKIAAWGDNVYLKNPAQTQKASQCRL